MRTDDIAPRTWLLAALAVWTVLAWLATLAGLGGRVAPLGDDASLLQPLPQLRPSRAQRLGPHTQYGEIASRPLFSDDRRPKPFSLGGAEDEEKADTFEYILTSVVISPKLKLAILQPKEGKEGEAVTMKLGESVESIPGWQLVSLEPRKAVFEGPEGERSLDLRVFDGEGGQPATATTKPTNPNQRSAPPRTPVRSGAAEAADAAQVAANAAADAGDENASRGARSPRQGARTAPPPPAPQPNASAEPTTSEAQIEAIRQRIQARREQLRRESEQSQ